VSSVAADRLIRKRRGRLGPIHEAQRRHVVVVGSHADNHALAAVSARPRSAFTYISALSLASPASETRHPWRGCEDRAYICACRSTDPLYIVRTAQNHLLVRWIRQTGSHRHAKRSEMHFARRTWHFVPHNHAAPRSPYSLDTVATEPPPSSAPLLQQPPPCIPHSAYVIILHSQS
jgi:hypothetical protein